MGYLEELFIQEAKAVLPKCNCFCCGNGAPDASDDYTSPVLGNCVLGTMILGSDATGTSTGSVLGNCVLDTMILGSNK